MMVRITDRCGRHRWNSDQNPPLEDRAGVQWPRFRGRTGNPRENLTPEGKGTYKTGPRISFVKSPDVADGVALRFEFDRLQTRAHRRTARRVVATASLAAFAAIAAGCVVVPAPMTKRVRGYAGEPPNNTVDMKFLRIGETKREDVLQNLHWADSGISEDRLFWGRWISSGSGWAWAVAGGASSESGANRNWAVHNLLVEFDENGIVNQVHEATDSQLLAQLCDALVRSKVPPLELRNPIEVKAKHQRRTQGDENIVLQLERNALEVKKWDDGKHDFRVSPERIERVATSGLGDPFFAQVSMHLSQKTAAGSNPSFIMRPADLLVFAKYLQLVHPSALPAQISEGKR